LTGAALPHLPVPLSAPSLDCEGIDGGWHDRSYQPSESSHAITIAMLFQSPECSMALIAVTRNLLVERIQVAGTAVLELGGLAATEGS
jgi:hypothetical protein